MTFAIVLHAREFPMPLAYSAMGTHRYFPWRHQISSEIPTLVISTVASWDEARGCADLRSVMSVEQLVAVGARRQRVPYCETAAITWDGFAN